MPVVNGFNIGNAVIPCCQNVGGYTPDVQKLATPSIIFTGTTSGGFVVDWQDIAGATTYDLTLATDVGFSANVVNANGLTASTYTATGRSASTLYYVRVIAHDSTGTNTDSNYGYGNTTTSAGLQSPTGLSSQRSSNSAMLSWFPGTGTETCYLQVSATSNFSSYQEFNLNTGDQQFEWEVTGLNNGVLYYWRVKSQQTGQPDTSYATSQFTTLDTLLEIGGVVSAGGMTLSGSPSLKVHFNIVSNPTSPNNSQDNFIVSGTNRGNVAMPNDYTQGDDIAVSYNGTTHYGPNQSQQYFFIQGQPVDINIT